ncbi:Cna B-type domain-containing protein [Candidatus Saccharibacteria bacterium]|nr:Cna B-type domain-containing protein [Candidatus Saccharibacteria bacterium]
MKKQKPIIKRFMTGLMPALMIFALVGNSASAFAATNKVLVTDSDDDGTISIGDKFCLGTECFFVTKNEDGAIQALAEYNLYAGYNVIDMTEEFGGGPQRKSSSYETIWDRGFIGCTYNSRHDKTLCLEPIDYTIELNDEMVGLHEWDEVDDNCRFYDYNGGEYNDDGIWLANITHCYTFNYKDADPMQSSVAISKHGGSKETGSEYPEIGDFFFNNGTHYYKGEEEEWVQMYFNEDNELTRGNFIFNYLDDYKGVLNNLGAGQVDDVNILTYNNFADILTAINTDKTFEHNGYHCDNGWTENEDGSWNCVDSGYPYVWSIEDEVGNYTAWVGRSSIKEYIPEQYNWLYSTTYWLGTAFYEYYGAVTAFDSYSEKATTLAMDADFLYSESNNYLFFIDTIGDLCYVDGQNGCNDPSIGAGIRPLITMSEDQFELNRLDIEGTIRWIDDSDASKIRPGKSVIKLFRNGELIDSVEVTREEGEDDEEDIWRFAFKNLLKYDANGEPYVYTITQDDIELYASDVDGFNVVNEYAPDAPAVPNTGIITGHDNGLKAENIMAAVGCVASLGYLVFYVTKRYKSSRSVRRF